jgi:hypothetical protein
MKKIVVMTLLLVLSVAVFAQGTEPKLDVFDFIKNMDWVNVVLVAIFSIGGIVTKYAITGRTKLKEVGELLILIYQYTDDKVLSKKEREDLWDHILVIIGKKEVEGIQDKVLDQVMMKGSTREVIKSKTKIKIKTRRK